MSLQRKSSFSSGPQKIQLKQSVSREDITKRVQYIQDCVTNKCPVDMRQMVNLYRLAELYNFAVHKQHVQKEQKTPTNFKKQQKSNLSKKHISTHTKTKSVKKK